MGLEGGEGVSVIVGLEVGEGVSVIVRLDVGEGVSVTVEPDVAVEVGVHVLVGIGEKVAVGTKTHGRTSVGVRSGAVAAGSFPVGAREGKSGYSSELGFGTPNAKYAGIDTIISNMPTIITPTMVTVHPLRSEGVWLGLGLAPIPRAIILGAHLTSC